MSGAGEVPRERRGGRPRLYPFEWFTYGVTFVIVVFLRAHDLRVGWKTIQFTVLPMFGQLYRPLAIGLVLHAAVTLAQRESLRAWWRAVATPQSALLWLRVWLASMAMTYGYTWLKTCVPLLRTTVYDAALWRLDRIVHFGISPSIFAVELVKDTPVMFLIERWYKIWLLSVLVALAYFFLSPDLAKRRNFALACTTLWLVGAWIYFAFPAVGPCYTVPEVFTGILARLRDTKTMQDILWHNYGLMLAGRDGSLRQFNPYYGVAAMPSLHVGAHWLFTLWSWRHARRLTPIFALATMITLLGSIATGWHYALDGYAGMLLAWCAVRFADRFEPVAASVPAGGGEDRGGEQAGDQRDGDHQHAEG